MGVGLRRLGVLIAAMFVATTVTVALPATAANPATATEPPVDQYYSRTAPGACTGFTQPGVEDFRDMILSRVGGGNGSTHRCGENEKYEHREGRAWDWMNDADNPGDVARVESVLSWLLATVAGEPHAMARRLGLAYIIWNHQIIDFYSTTPDKSWRDYICDGSPSSCHTNHVHFSFQWQGAERETTWFTTDPRPVTWYPFGEGQLYREPDGTVAVIVGGSPAVFTNMDARRDPTLLQAPQVDVEAGSFAAMPRRPHDGTLVRDAQTGAVSVVAGGRALSLETAEWEALGSAPSIVVPASYLKFLALSSVRDGTYVRDLETGAVYIVAGDAKFELIGPELELLGEPDTLGDPAWTDLPQRILDTFGAVPSFGTILRDYAPPHEIYRVAAGSMLNELTPQEYTDLGTPPFTTVPTRWIDQFVLI